MGFSLTNVELTVDRRALRFSLAGVPIATIPINREEYELFRHLDKKRVNAAIGEDSKGCLAVTVLYEV